MKCKQGDIAFIKKSIRQVNIGRVVTCKEMIGYYIMGEEIIWNSERFIAQDTDYFWVISSKSGIETMYGKSLDALSPDSWLEPIKADGMTDEDPTEKLLEDSDLLTI